jgi:thiol:disulfide interchange protein
MDMHSLYPVFGLLWLGFALTAFLAMLFVTDDKTRYSIVRMAFGLVLLKTAINAVIASPQTQDTMMQILWLLVAFMGGIHFTKGWAEFPRRPIRFGFGHILGMIGNAWKVLRDTLKMHRTMR